MTRVLTILAWLILAIVLVAPVAYIVIVRPEAPFWSDLMVGTLSTALALVAGVPLALWIDRHIKGREAAELARTERTRELEFLELLKEELEFDRKGLALRKPDTVEIQPLKSDLWVSAAAAGKLNLIRSHRLLNRIASAYYVIDVVRGIEKQAYVALRSATVTFGNGQTALQQTWADARRFDQLLYDSISEAIRDIDSYVAAAA
jgi:hypothetical protein